MKFCSVDDITDREKKYDGIIALSYSATDAPWNVLEESTTTDIVTGTCVTWWSTEAATLVGAVNKPNPTKENLINQIRNIPEHRDFYDAEENPPNARTKDDAERVILGVAPSGLLAGADVYGYYGAVHIGWETQRKKLKLVVPPYESHQQPTLYHGQMEDGRVTESDIEPGVDSKILRKWLDWLQG